MRLIRSSIGSILLYIVTCCQLVKWSSCFRALSLLLLFLDLDGYLLNRARAQFFLDSFIVFINIRKAIHVWIILRSWSPQNKPDYISFMSESSFALSHPRTSQIIFERVQIWINTTSKTSTHSHRLRLRTIRHRLSHLDSDLLYFTHQGRCQKNPPRPLQQPSQHSEPSSKLYLSVDQQRWLTRFVSSEG